MCTFMHCYIREATTLDKLKYALSKDAQTLLYHSLVHLYFICGLTVWGNTLTTYIFKLHRLKIKPL